MMDLELNIGLGSDRSRDHEISIIKIIVLAIQLPKMKYLENNKEWSFLSTSEAFYLGTKGGGKFFGKVCSFEEVYEFDLLNPIYSIHIIQCFWKNIKNSIFRRF